MGHDRLGLDWGLIRSFMAVVDEGSLSAAAQVLGQTQPTLGRQIQALEREIGASLFQRHGRGLELTEDGQALLPAASDMLAAARRLALAADGQSEELAGTVRITASKVVSQFLLPELLAGLRIEVPEIELELVPSDSSENLLYREADIAIRMYRPKQLELVATHVGDQPLALYASKEYLQRYGKPDSVDELQKHHFVGFDRSEMIIDTMRELGWEVTRHSFATRCDDQVVYWELGRAGCGLVATQQIIGDRDPSMVRVVPDLALGTMPFWVAAPEALRSTPRIRCVYDFLVRHLRDELTRGSSE